MLYTCFIKTIFQNTNDVVYMMVVNEMKCNLHKNKFYTTV